MNPSQATARKMVLVSALALVAIAVYREKQTGASGMFKRLWGVGVISVILSLVADFLPGIAGPFAVLIVLGSLSNGGDKAIANALGSVSAKVPSATAAPAAPAAPAKSSSPAQTHTGPQ